MTRALATLGAVCFVLSVALPVSAQITTGSVTGSIRDSQNAVIPGANVTMVSATRGTSTNVTSTAAGDFVFPNVQADTYLIRVTLDGFKTLERPGVIVAPGDRVVVGALTIEIGLLNETVTVAGEAPMIQAQSGERSYSISAEAVQNLAINGRSYQDLIALAPGYAGGTFSGQRTNQRNIQVDAFNALNSVRVSDRNSQLVVRSLTDPTPTNLAKDATGNVVNLRGFGAVTAVGPAREIQLMARFQF